jgi:hypothetical protein
MGLMERTEKFQRRMLMNPKKNQPYQRAYLLRCWQEGEVIPGNEPYWRFSVEEIPQDKQRRQGFNSLGALFAFLRAELVDGQEEPAEPRSSRPGRADAGG